MMLHRIYPIISSRTHTLFDEARHSKLSSPAHDQKLYLLINLSEPHPGHIPIPTADRRICTDTVRFLYHSQACPKLLALPPSSSSSAPESGLSNTGAPSAAAGSSSSSFAGPSRDGSEPDYETNRPVNFVVTESGTSYQRATLASQVREQLAAVTPSAATHTASSVPNSASPAATAESSASASSPPRTAPSARLQGCVSRVTHGVTPSLVEEGSYDGIPAYIIAVPSHAWAVRLGCTAADPEQITSVSLTGLFRESQRPRIG